jgi:hypothetical protein
MANEDITVQDLLSKVLLDGKSDDNETLQIIEFIRDNGVPLTPEQARGVLILNMYGLNDVANYFLNVRKIMTPMKLYQKMVEKLTLADRIKGNAKLGNILKANANPAGDLNTAKALGPQK